MKNSMADSGISKPLVIFDGHCGFCRIWIEYWKRLTEGRLDFAPFQQVADDFPSIPHEAFQRSVQFVEAEGRRLGGAAAVFETLRYAPGYQWLVWLYRHSVLVRTLSESGYYVVAAHRDIAYPFTVLLFGKSILPARYEAVEWLFIRVLAAIYLIAFVSFGLQIQGLIGSKGILPLDPYLAALGPALGAHRFWVFPTVFWISASDQALSAVWISGAVLAVALLAGFAQRFCLGALFVLYLSLTLAGQDFMSFQWDMLLLEAGFLAVFLGSSPIVVWTYRWLLFRLMFSSGAVKLLSHDPEWRNLNALRFHYWTQPLPTPLAWYMNLLPDAFQRASTAMVFFIELLAPFLIFFPRRARLFGAAWLALLQVLILLTGNYAFFNWLTLALCLFLLDDSVLPRLPKARNFRTSPKVAAVLVVVIGVLSWLQLMRTWFEYLPPGGEAVLQLASPFGIVNSYGLFAVMTTTRPSIIVEGSNDGVDWRPYEFRFQSEDLNRAPTWVAPYQPRLDWQMWFAALGSGRGWFTNFMVRLLQGSAPVNSLLQPSPFGGKPPQFVRARLYEYRFTTWEERQRTRNWWQRTEKGLYFPAISLKDLQR